MPPLKNNNANTRVRPFMQTDCNRASKRQILKLSGAVSELFKIVRTINLATFLEAAATFKVSLSSVGIYSID